MFRAGRIQEKPGLLDADRYHGVIMTNTLPEDDRFLAEAALPYPAVILGRRIAGRPNPVANRARPVACPPCHAG